MVGAPGSSLLLASCVVLSRPLGLVGEWGLIVKRGRYTCPACRVVSTLRESMLIPAAHISVLSNESDGVSASVLWKKRLDTQLLFLISIHM